MRQLLLVTVSIIYAGFAAAQNVASVSATAGGEKAALTLDGNAATAWTLSADELRQGQHIIFNLANAGEVKGITIDFTGLNIKDIHDALKIYITYDPMNWGEAVSATFQGAKPLSALFAPKYGAHIKLEFRTSARKSLSISEITVIMEETATLSAESEKPWMNASLPVEQRVEMLLQAMTPADKMELIREGWGIPGIPHLGVPDIKKVEAVHGFSYGSGATIFPQAIALGATWNKRLAEQVAEVIGDETVAAGAVQAWSPVLDVAQDARWGRCEETFGEDPVLVSEIGGAWIKGYQSKGLMTTPKHFAVHGAPLGGRDSHDIGLSEREIREVHLVPFRHVIRNYHCQSLMMAYSDFLGVPVAKSAELLNGILREEWGFNGFIVSDCGAIGNLTARKHYTAKDYVEAANQALAAGTATNCGDVYNNKDVIAAAKEGLLNMENLDNVCRTLLATMFRNGLFENNRSRALDWNKQYDNWQSPEHVDAAREAARQSIVLLENRDNILPLSKNLKTIAVIGPGADALQPGDYSPKLQEGQLKSVLTGVKEAVGGQTKVLYEKGCEFTSPDNYEGEKACAAARQSDVVVMVLGDCTQENDKINYNTTGENHDYASLTLPGRQEELLKQVSMTGKPVILLLQAGRPYNINVARELCKALMVIWLPGQEGGRAAADALFGDFNPAGRLPMTFPRHVGQLPDYYNFKTSGRRYEYSDMPFEPLYRFGYGMSYTQFEYSDLQTNINDDGSIKVSVKVKNTGSRKGDEVVQMYLTDMYASVKTRVMELKDFERVSLEPGATLQVDFTLTPYQLSLLNERMDRVVEAGEFRVHVGGASPTFKAGNAIKESIGYKSAAEGLTAKIDYPHEFAAKFTLEYAGSEEVIADGSKRLAVRVRNDGTLMDVGKISLYADGVNTGETHHFELGAGEEKIIRFTLRNKDVRNIDFVTKERLLNVIKYETNCYFSDYQ
jgi:beta-glucosidase